MKEISLTVDGIKIKAQEGQSILNAALDAGIYIPHLCSHPDLPPEGECKLCVVECGGETLLSCMTEAEEGMVVHTNSDKLHHIRVTALELMLACHPHDCTSCKVYLNCELQAMMQYIGAVHSRLRTIEKKNLKRNTGNPLIVRELERCIQCGRCVRACEEIRGVGILDYRKVDDETYIGTRDDLSLADSDCRFCGACIAVCPTGALLDVEGSVAKEGPPEFALIPCRSTCPAHIDIPRYIRLIKEGKFADAAAVIRERAPFPASLGHVCNRPCEGACRRDFLNQPVSIRNLKRFAAEQDTDRAWLANTIKEAPTGKKVAVIGSGPCGMTAAYYLNRRGHEVTVFEKLPVAGGMIATAVPEYRLPREVVREEIDLILDRGVKLITDHEVNSVKELLSQGFDAVLVAVGASQGRKIGLPGADMKRIYTAVDLLRAAALNREIELGNTVTVLGGGNVAFDCARVSRRLGVENVNVICLEAEGEMLADDEEINQGREEGITIYNSKTFTQIKGEKNMPVGVECIDVAEFHFDSDGRLQLQTKEGSESVVPADTVIFATGQKTDLTDSFGVSPNTFGFLDIDGKTFATEQEAVFAAGDVVTGTKSVIEAISAGRLAAEQIDLYLGGDGDISEVLLPYEEPEDRIGKVEGFAYFDRKEPDIEKLDQRVCSFARVDLGLDENSATGEAERCLQCDLRKRISKPKMWTDYIKK